MEPTIAMLRYGRVTRGACMQLFPMDVPAVMHRVAAAGDEIVVARGPLVIMAHGLMALDPKDRKGCWISTQVGDLTPYDAEQALQGWSKRH
jgi:hypothetical protein